ncbi:HAD family hydrolase [Streptomyces sp. NPDC017993]|uniref:HAD family hydrolase n=1 Tax=Streptomyces sp. NPDC017993 TaxID=3365027 RepID=UPI0037AC8106
MNDFSTSDSGAGAVPNEPRAAVFDVDGTLADTNYLHTVAWWEALHQAGHQVPMWQIHRSIGMDSAHLLERLLGRDRRTEQDAAISAAHATLYGTWRERLPALDGARELLRTVAGRGWRVVLATSARGSELTALREAIDADDAILGATTSDDVDQGKPAPDVVESALRQAEVPPERAVFIGDTVWDIQAASRVGVPCIALLSGGISRGELIDAGAAAVYENAAALRSALDSSPLAD